MYHMVDLALLVVQLYAKAICYNSNPWNKIIFMGSKETIKIYRCGNAGTFTRDRELCQKYTKQFPISSIVYILVTI